MVDILTFDGFFGAKFERAAKTVGFYAALSKGGIG